MAKKIRSDLIFTPSKEKAFLHRYANGELPTDIAKSMGTNLVQWQQHIKLNPDVKEAYDSLRDENFRAKEQRVEELETKLVELSAKVLDDPEAEEKRVATYEKVAKILATLRFKNRDPAFSIHINQTTNVHMGLDQEERFRQKFHEIDAEAVEVHGTDT